ncbi:MAG: potassium-transporting ATPase subunit KdpA, partial [Ignavibacteria bacterium]
MKTLDIIQILFFILILTALTPPLGRFMYNVFTGKKNILTPVLGKLENLIYKFIRVNQEVEMNRKKYLWAVLLFNFVGFTFLFTLQIVQQWLPLNPQGLPNVPYDLAFNTAVSFMTNTNWQAYGGENTMSYAVQMLGLAVQNFLSAATGIAVLLALIRGIVNKLSDKLGNFWVDMVRATLYIFIPLSILVSVLLLSQGVVQNFSSYTTVKTVEGIEQV